MTRQEAQYYSEACIAFSEDLEGAAIDYQGLTLESSCNWAVYGFTVQGWFNTEQNLILISNYVQKLEYQIEFYKKQLENRYEHLDKD